MNFILLYSMAANSSRREKIISFLMAPSSARKSSMMADLKRPRSSAEMPPLAAPPRLNELGLEVVSTGPVKFFGFQEVVLVGCGLASRTGEGVGLASLAGVDSALASSAAGVSAAAARR